MSRTAARTRLPTEFQIKQGVRTASIVGPRHQLPMTDLNNTSEHDASNLLPADARSPFLLSTVVMLAAMTALGFVAVLGYSTGRCGDIAGTVLWSIFIAVAGLYAAAESPVEFTMGVCACIAVAALLTRLPIKVTWKRFAVVSFALYIVVALVAWIAGAEHSCRVL